MHNVAENELFKRMIGLVCFSRVLYVLLYVHCLQSPGIPSTTLTSEVTKLKEKIRVLEVGFLCIT